MRISRKVFITSAVFAGGLLAGSIAYAAITSATFATKAQAWANANCNQSLANSKNKSTSMAICYNFFKNQEQDAEIAGILKPTPTPTPTPTPSPSRSEPILVDGNGIVLGPEINSDTYDFYDSALKRNVHVNSSGQVTVDIAASFTSNNCTGTPYSINDASNIQLYKGGSTTPGTFTYYVVANNHTQTSTQTLHSQLEGNGTCLTDGAGGLPTTADVWQLTTTSINFTDPIPMPIHFQ